MPGPLVTVVEKGGLPVKAVDSGQPLLTVGEGGLPSRSVIMARLSLWKG